MQILLDDVPCDVEALTVAEAIAAGAGIAEDKGRLIVDVTVDGTRWTGDDPAADACGAAVVSMRSALPPELVRQTFAEADEALLRTDALQSEAAELLQSGQVAAAMAKLNAAMSIWMYVREAVVKGAALAELDLPGASSTLDEAAKQLQDRLGVLRAALRDGDHVAISDTLLYEFPEVVARWRALLWALTQQVQ